MRIEASQLKEKLSLAEEELDASKTHLSRAQIDVKSLQDAQQEQEEANTRLKDKLSRLEASNILSHTTSRHKSCANSRHI